MIYTDMHTHVQIRVWESSKSGGHGRKRELLWFISGMLQEQRTLKQLGCMHNAERMWAILWPALRHLLDSSLSLFEGTYIGKENSVFVLLHIENSFEASKQFAFGKFVRSSSIWTHSSPKLPLWLLLTTGEFSPRESAKGQLKPLTNIQVTFYFIFYLPSA